MCRCVGARIFVRASAVSIGMFMHECVACGTAWQAAWGLPSLHLSGCLWAGVTWHVTGWSMRFRQMTCLTLSDNVGCHGGNHSGDLFLSKNSTSAEKFHCSVDEQKSSNPHSSADNQIMCRCWGWCINKDNHPDIYSFPYQLFAHQCLTPLFASVDLTSAHTLIAVCTCCVFLINTPSCHLSLLNTSPFY